MVNFRVLTFAMCLCAGAVLALPAYADPLPEKGPNGGLLRESGEHHIELLVKGQALTVHLLDHKNKATSEAGVTGKATLSAGTAKESITLTAQANGVFVGTSKLPATGPLQVDVVLTAPNEPPLLASFNVVR
jgi:hypothetical protein